MPKFVYCDGLDQLQWYIYPHEHWPFKCELSKEQLSDTMDRRFQTAKWLNDNCVDKVYAWNRCEAPRPHDTDWGRKVAPQGDITLYFTLKEDYVKFLLTTDMI